MKTKEVLMKALQMVGLNVNEHQTLLIIRFIELLERKGQQATLQDIEDAGQLVNSEMKAKEKILTLGK
jgi:hypothetical protein